MNEDVFEKVDSAIVIILKSMFDDDGSLYPDFASSIKQIIKKESGSCELATKAYLKFTASSKFFTLKVSSDSIPHIDWIEATCEINIREKMGSIKDFQRFSSSEIEIYF